MTKCETGVWYGWNGGECPVHPKTVVEIQMKECRGECPSERLRWEQSGHDDDIVAFRVTKEHKEPREFWARKQTMWEVSWWDECYPDDDGAVLFREVVE